MLADGAPDTGVDGLRLGFHLEFPALVGAAQAVAHGRLGAHPPATLLRANNGHSDLHVMQGLMAHPTPVVLGHEGAGVVESVGPGVTGVQVGDHVLTSYVLSCGRCPWCVVGRPNLCDQPRYLMHDGTWRFRQAGESVYHFLQVSSYAERAVLPEQNVVPIRKAAPLYVVCLVSCGVMTGAGAVINRARVTPGSSVVGQCVNR